MTFSGICVEVMRKLSIMLKGICSLFFKNSRLPHSRWLTWTMRCPNPPTYVQWNSQYSTKPFASWENVSPPAHTCSVVKKKKKQRKYHLCAFELKWVSWGHWLHLPWRLWLWTLSECTEACCTQPWGPQQSTGSVQSARRASTDGTFPAGEETQSGHCCMVEMCLVGMWTVHK